MHAQSSTVSSFFSGQNAVVAKELMVNGTSADWLIELIDCSVLIEEKAMSQGVRRHMADSAASQLESIETMCPTQARVLWLTYGANDVSASEAKTSAPQLRADDEFFRQHQGIDGVVYVQVDDMKVRAQLVVNLNSRHASQLTSSSFAKCLANARYFPVEFPTESSPGIVSGSQPKLLLQRGAGGMYSSAGLTHQELKERMAVASDIVQQLGQYFNRKKSEHPDWTNEKNLERIRRGLQAKALEGKWPFTKAEQQWMMARLREVIALA